TAINLKTGTTGVTATAYNIFKGAGGASGITTGNLTINNDTVAASGSMEELVDNINRDVAGVTATLNKDGSLTLSNDTGADIIMANIANTGLTADTFKGYISLSDENNEAISITADTGALPLATATQVNSWGLNISTGSTSVTGGDVSGVALAAGDLEINGVSVGKSTGSSAGDKAVAINVVSAETGVTASARTEETYVLDFTHPPLTATDVTINGAAVDLVGVTNLEEVVSLINALGSGVVASANIDGELVLTSESGLDIVTTDPSGFIGPHTTKGTILLTSTTGADIKIGGNAEEKAGFVEQGGSSEAIGAGLSVMTLQNANNAIERIDEAIDRVSENRA
ncbi:MAG: flagellin hook IN motif-containing protein, partial [Victivallaceae bacterium]